MLATYGVGQDGKLYVHIKIFKQRRLFGEIVAFGGPLCIRCRNCLRFHTVVFKGNESVALEQIESPGVPLDVPHP